MTTVADTDDSPTYSKLNALSVFLIAATTAFLTASVMLIFQYKQGIPFGFVTSLSIAAAAALIAPILVALICRRWVPSLPYPALTGFAVANFLIALITGVLIF
ncbi:MAG: hypothetical protein AAF465_12205 [Pseudomonadota bacterium]